MKTLSNSIKLIPTNYEANRRKMWSIGFTVSKLHWKQSSNIAAKNVRWTCPTLNWICLASSDISKKAWDMSGLPRNFPRFISFFPTLILELRDTKLDETWTQGSPQYKEYIPKRGFSKFKDFPFDFGLTQKPKHWRWTHEIFKSNVLKPLDCLKIYDTC
jgi:hypothetical protein